MLPSFRCHFSLSFSFSGDCYCHCPCHCIVITVIFIVIAIVIVIVPVFVLPVIIFVIALSFPLSYLCYYRYHQHHQFNSFSPSYVVGGKTRGEPVGRSTRTRGDLCRKFASPDGRLAQNQELKGWPCGQQLSATSCYKTAIGYGREEKS